MSRVNSTAEVMSAIGDALWTLQSLENSLAHLIALVLRMSAASSLEEAESILENTHTGTLGRLLDQVKKVESANALWEIRLRTLLERRNWLVHRSWRSHSHFEEDEGVRADLLARVRSLTNDALHFDAYYKTLIEWWAMGSRRGDPVVAELAKQFMYPYERA